MTIVAELANGDRLEFPDGIDPRIVDMIAKKHSVSTGYDMGQAALYAPGKAAAGIAGLAGDVRDLVAAGKNKAAEYLPDWVNSADKVAAAISPFNYLARALPTSGRLRGAAEQVTGPWYDPVTRAGKATDTAVQAGTTFGRSLVTNPLQALPIVAGITAGTEGAGALTNDNPWARLGGGLLGGGIPAAAQAMRNRLGVVLKDAIGKKTPDEISAAIARQEQAAAQGIPLMGTESFDAGHQLAASVLAHPTSNKAVEQFLRQRPQQIEQAVQGGLLAPTGAMATPEVNAARAQAAATDVIGNAEAARTAAVNPFFRAAEQETIPSQAMSPVANEINRLLYKAPENSPALKDIGNWAKQIYPIQRRSEELQVAAPTIGTAQSDEVMRTLNAVQKNAGLGKKKASIQVDPNSDDIVTAIRKLGGINPKDESIGSLAKHYVFSPDPRFGPVWRQEKGRGATGSVVGHSPDRMAEMLYEKGYLNSRDDLPEMMSKIEDAALGGKQSYSMFYQPPSDNPLLDSLDSLKELLAQQGKGTPIPDKVRPPVLGYLPETNVGKLHGIYKDLGVTRQLPEIGATAEQKLAAYPAGKLQDVLGKILTEKSSSLAEGNRLYQQLTQNIVEPLRAGPVGVVAGKAGFDPAAASAVPRIVSAIADANVARPETIRSLYTQLNQVDAQAFPGIVQTHLQNQLNTALGNIRSGPNPTAGAKFAQAIAGTPQERANFAEMMRGVARASGADPEATVKGANNLLVTLELTGRTAGIGSPTAGRGEINKELGKTLLGDTLSTISITPTRPLARRLDDWIQRGRYEELAAALTRPDSVQKLVRMAKLAPGSMAARYYATSLLGLDRALNEPGQ